jgi:ribosomal protein S18 acetylase RimI-like enzyme
MDIEYKLVDFSLERIRIRKVQSADLPALEWDGEYIHFRRLYAEAYRRSEIGEAILWVAEDPIQGIVGQLFVHLKSERKELADGRNRAYIYGFRVRPVYRNQGIGTLLLDTSEQDLLQRGFRWTVLNVARDNPDARRLYERRGYRVIGGDPGRWSYIDERGIRRDVVEPAWRMLKDLKAISY